MCVFSMRRRHTWCALVTGVQTCALPIFAVATERAERDPAHDLRDTLPARPSLNYAHIIVPEEVGGLMRAIDAFSGTFTVACALKLAPLWFVRPGELRAAEWKEFDLVGLHPTWRIPPVRLKLKKAVQDDPKTPPHLVPLSRQATAILKELKPLTGKQRYQFPSIRNRRSEEHTSELQSL